MPYRGRAKGHNRHQCLVIPPGPNHLIKHLPSSFDEMKSNSFEYTHQLMSATVSSTHVERSRSIAFLAVFHEHSASAGNRVVAAVRLAGEISRCFAIISQFMVVMLSTHTHSLVLATVTRRSIIRFLRTSVVTMF